MEQPAFKVEDLSPEGQQTFRIYSILDRLLSKVAGLDANDALLFVEARQWLQFQAKTLVTLEQQKASLTKAAHPSELKLVEDGQKL